MKLLQSNGPFQMLDWILIKWCHGHYSLIHPVKLTVNAPHSGPGLFWTVRIQWLLKGGSRIHMQAFRLQGPWLFTSMHTGVLLAGNACVTSVCDTDTHVCSERALAPKRAVQERLSNHTHLLQLFDAGGVHHDLAGCTLSPGH